MNGKYWLYFLSARWEEDGEPRSDDALSVGLPPGRRMNWISWDNMFREEQTIDELVSWARKEIVAYLEKKATPNPKRPWLKPIINPSKVIVVVTFKYRTDWCLTWFNHWTFDEGQTDADVIASFEKYVREAQKEGLCVMGAEDRWRWKGGYDADHPTEPPCRCKFCKEQGVIRINH